MSDTAGDRELLELAARAAGMSVCTSDDWGSGEWSWNEDGLLFARDGREWAPLTDDGDALRLAVKLNIDIERAGNRVGAFADHDNGYGIAEYAQSTDHYAATRRAITMAAAAIARATTKGDAK